MPHPNLPPSWCSFLLLLQDLEEEGAAVRVGSLAVRWVLMEHAEPWLLTVSSKLGVQPPEASRPAEPEQAGSSRRKRCRRHTTRQSGEPPAKRTEKDGREDDADEELNRAEGERMNGEREDEKVRRSLNEGGELQLPEAEEKTKGTDATEQQPPAEEVPESSSAPTQAADADGE